MRRHRYLHQIACLALLALVGVTPAYAQDEAADEQAGQQPRTQQDWVNAAKLLTELTKRDPDNARNWLELGYSFHQLKDYARAIPAYEKAITFDQTRSTALYNLACAQALTGARDQALTALELLVSVGGVGPGQVRRDADFASIKNDPRFVAVLAALGSAPEDSPARQFDFWVGEWDVHGPNGQLVGTSVITSRMNGWIIHEAWTSRGGSVGESINFYDVERDSWRQLWLSENGTLVEYQGEWRDGAIRYDSGRLVKADGSKTIQRSFFEPLSDGRVHQFIETSSDEGVTWTIYFDGYYTRSEPSSGS